MPSYQRDYVPAMTSMSGGKDNTPGVGMKWEVTYTGPQPESNEKFRFVIADGQTSLIQIYGYGDATGIEPTFCYVYHDKVYLIAGSSTFFCAIGDPLTWNDPNGDGNGFVAMDNQTQLPEDVLCMVPFQGKVGFLSRRNIQVWQVEEDPNDWAFAQLLVNIGTLAKDSARPTGEIDVLFLSDTGIRSLRVHSTTGNAYVDDLGSPIDKLVRNKIIDDEETAKLSCAVVEPTTGQYWIFINDTIFVLSYFPSAKVIAWSTFTCVDSEGDTFVPEKFVVYNGQVFCRAGNKVYIYGGSDKNTYDATMAIAETPWLDLKTPKTNKYAEALSIALDGAWKVRAGMDPISGITSIIYDGGDKSSYDYGIIPMTGYGTHVKFRMESVDTMAAVLGSLVFQYRLGEKK